MLKSTSMKRAFLGLFASLMIAGSVNAAAQVNISGATLFADFFKDANSTRDYIDVDNDELTVEDVVGLTPLQKITMLNNIQLAEPWQGDINVLPTDSYWYVTYRGVGSGNGLKELNAWYAANPSGYSSMSVPDEDAAFNTLSWVTRQNANNPGGCPIDQDSVDIAVMDVPTMWFVQSGDAADAAWGNTPNSSGYGKCPVAAWDGNGSNVLKQLTGSLTIDQVYDTSIAWVPIAIIANPGTNMTQISKEDLQYLFTTGRTSDGKNLQACTRDSGSGTRNGAMNSLGIDPSWGRGENWGKKYDVSSLRISADGFQTANLGGSSTMENVVQNVRLGIGYTGLMGGSRAAADAAAGKYNLLAVDFNNNGSAMLPTKANAYWYNGTSVLTNGWPVGGSETMATVGDPYSDAYGNPASVGTNATPAMASENAALYIQNIIESTNTFIHDPDDPNSGYSPAETLAKNFTLISTLPYLPELDNPTSFVPQTGYAATALDLSYDMNSMATVSAVDTSFAGKQPTRAAGSYSDNDAAVQDKYYALDGTVISWSASSAAHLVTGDMNRNGSLDNGDLAALALYVSDEITYTAQYASAEASTFCPEIIADFNVNGSVDADDVRYFADGLYMVNGKLDRTAAFAVTEVAALLGDDAMFDIAGNAVVAAGSAPMGADGLVNTADAAYMVKVLSGGLVGEKNNPYAADLDWSDINDAVKMDLSCDMNGDMHVNKTDLSLMLAQLPANDPFYYMNGIADMDMDGDVDVVDFGMFAAQWLK